MGDRGNTGSRAWYLLLLLPIVGLLWVPIYAKQTPELFGIPFFYWYQFAWVPASVVVTYLVYAMTRTRGLPPDRRADAPPAPLEPGPGRSPGAPGAPQ